MNQYGENKNNINTNSGLQNLSINNDKNTNAKVSEGLIEVSKVKKIQFECPVCHEEYDRSQFFGGRKKWNPKSTCKSCIRFIW